MKVNVFATVAILIGAMLAVWIAGPPTLVFVVVALILYNQPRKPLKKIVK